MNTKKCTSCGAEIVFIVTPQGKYMPCDAAPVGVVHPPEKLVSEKGDVFTYQHGDGLDGAMKYYRPHWATCSGAAKHRRPAT